MRHCIRWVTPFLLIFILVSPAASWPSIFPTGTTFYNPDAAYDSYTLFAPLAIKSPLAEELSGGEPAIINLINMNGQVVHSWKVPFSPLSATLLKNGNLLVVGQYNDSALPVRPGWGQWFLGGAAGFLVELDWEGKKVFEHIDPRMHHEAVKLENGNYIYLDWERVPPNLVSKVRGGIKGSEFTNGIMFNDRLVEIDGKGKVVWQWHANEHLDPNIDIIGPMYKRNEWCHGNSIDILKNGNILLTSRSLDALLVIEKSTGKIIFRWGSGNRLNKQGQIESVVSEKSLGAPHDGTLIPVGYPGAGNFLCYSNRTTNGDFMWSRAVEIDPATGKQVWETARRTVGRKEFSDYLGGAQRLPNGNTLLCDGANGRFFQVDKNSEVVWEYVSPFVQSRSFRGAMFKARAYDPKYCPQFAKLPPARGAIVLPPVANTEFRVAEMTKDRFAWRFPTLIGLACALMFSIAFNIYLWLRKGKHEKPGSSV